MDVSLYTGAFAAAAPDAMVVGVFEREVDKNPIVVELDRALGGVLVGAVADEGFEGKEKQTLVLHTHGKVRPKRIVLVGIGPREVLDEPRVVALGVRTTRVGREIGAKEILIVLPRELEAAPTLGLAARGALLGGYSFDRYKSDRVKKKHALKRAVLRVAAGSRAAGAAALARAQVTAAAVALARDLVNEPAIELNPESFARRTQQLATEVGLRCKILPRPALEKLGMNLLLGVGRGSIHEPRLVHLTYKPRRGARGAPVVLVGKGITFDSGGLSLKASTNMEDMKADMAGAAAVLATLRAVQALAPPVEVHGLMPLAENMPSGAAIRPGDVLASAAGKTVEVTNTDAEGRLVLADALHYAIGLAPRAIVDVATLTGACVVALGPHIVGLFANDDALAAEVLAAAKRTGESFWRLPLASELREQLKSEVADLKNTGAREGGAITAALFLNEFVGKTPWVHLDIAGPAMNKNRGEAKGATGVAVATLVELLTGRKHA